LREFSAESFERCNDAIVPEAVSVDSKIIVGNICCLAATC
jgi:hypothetical protein